MPCVEAWACCNELSQLFHVPCVEAWACCTELFHVFSPGYFSRMCVAHNTGSRQLFIQCHGSGNLWITVMVDWALRTKYPSVSFHFECCCFLWPVSFPLSFPDMGNQTLSAEDPEFLEVGVGSRGGSSMFEAFEWVRICNYISLCVLLWLQGLLLF